jgi:glycosyltransferase involved in cell wall biosynthesis
MQISVDTYLRKRSGKVRSWFPDTAENSAGKAAKWHGIAIVVPLYNEDFAHTLASLEAAATGDVRLYCVVNNRVSDSTEAKANNKVLLSKLKNDCSDEALSLVTIDAATEGREIPEGEGVGFARKIGMDFALAEGASVIACMDGDTLVSENYFVALADFAKTAHGVDAAVTAFEHQAGETPETEAAIRAYERFLSRHSRRLEACGSIYYKTALGPTIVCTREAYMQSGGMNTRTAGEDFYFLQALTKVLYGKGRLPVKLPTTVYPSARISNRVPFGTGQKIAEIVAGASPSAYPDAVYEQIAVFIALMNAGFSERIKTQLPAVYDFLTANNFFQDWEKICAQHHGAGAELALKRAFQFWFDGLKIIRLIHWLNSYAVSSFPP